MFSEREVERYARHLVLKEVGGPGQQKLRAASVLLIGAGGVGAPAALYLAAAGVGRIGLVDDDTVALSNLQRQVLFAEADVGRLKVEAGRERLSGLNGEVRVETVPVRLTAANGRALVGGWNLVIDGTDSFAARDAVNRACVDAGVPLIAGALGRWNGQIGLFRGRPCWACFAPEQGDEGDLCAVYGVVGALAGVVGSAAALLAVRTLVGAGEDAAGRLMLFDGMSWRTRTVDVAADPRCRVCGPATPFETRLRALQGAAAGSSDQGGAARVPGCGAP
jgi:molybdopterin/thiamine biosynthesis adenylyltransferase